MEKLESLVYLLELKQLMRLDLSNNNFSYSSIPRLMGSMKQLRYLYLLGASFGGFVPDEFGNLTNLIDLDLSFNMLSGEIPTSLGELKNLKNLNLDYNKLTFIAPSLRFPSNLETLDLSVNQLSGKIPTSQGKLSKLQTLDISYNRLLEGTILSEPHFANLSSLTYLSMGYTMLTLNLSNNWAPPFQLQKFNADTCKINGELPPWLQTQKSLSDLVWSNANISGFIPRWFHTMQQLEFVDLSNNNLSGSLIIPINFYSINLSNNSFTRLSLSNSSSKTEIYRQGRNIYLQNNLITGHLPKRLGNLMPNMEFLYLANNKIEGSIPNSLCQSTSLNIFDIQNNRLTGVIPNCWGLGPIIKPNLQFLGLSNNEIKGTIPDSLCQLTSLKYLHLQNNSLSGIIPNCLANLSTLTVVRLSYNKLNGRIPCFNNIDSYKFGLGFGDEFYLHLSDNMLTGEIPSCVSDLTNLKVLDVGGNQLVGKMFKWFNAQKFRSLKILRLRDNKFSGTIPMQICSLPYLQVMDLGHNHFTGSIPPCLSNLTTMISPNTSHDLLLGGVSEVIQGIERTYTSTLLYLVDIDLSCNNLIGSIPDDLTKLSGLLSLNLSCNHLSGTIPTNVGGLKSLIALDLSKNKLRGTIPTSMGQLYKLSHLNLSYNNLSGEIPTGNQLQTLSDQASIYAGNPYLCGDFLPRKCKSKAYELGKGASDKGNGDNEKKLKKMGFDLVVMSGFATGFLGVVGCLVLNRRLRHAFFRRLEDGYNWLYVIVVLKVRVLKAKMKRGE